ncbi:glycoside hydrolase family 55 protein [Ferruginibacter lapsinanis]|uniref:glycoside hydrolase family 55 protein n=1 Tax=Ferruginibacter lapsinanis TaxID=563172 RepID=UPI001E630111|nr:glycoside hydrolase family 55 protein [Ferruginibacter lapsinanis]UEG50572.1 glycoside hydrolase family 55 protein [Ferruginibacter lapsinanis]
MLKACCFFVLTIFFGLSAFSKTLNVTKFGARGNGKTDDTKAIQAAINAAVNYPNATVYFPAGIYLIDSYTKTSVYLINYCLKLHSNISFRGDGSKSVIKLASHIFDSRDTMANAHIFYGTNIKHVQFTGLLVDMNGANNLVPSGIIKNNMTLFVENGSDISISNITIKNCSGSNMIAIRGTGHGLLIKNCSFYNGGNYVGGATPNRYQTDFSFLYCTWDSTKIVNNRLEQQNPDIALSNYTGGIELHGSYSYAGQNTIIGCNPGLYISSTAHVLKGVVVANNKIRQCLRGIAFWIQHPITDITISNNYISITYPRLLKQKLSGIEIPNGNAMEYSDRQANNAMLNNITIVNNTITSLLTEDKIDKTSGMILHSLQNSTIKSNTISGMNYGGIVMEGSKWGMRSVMIRNNKFNYFKRNNDIQAVGGYVIITDSYSSKVTGAPGLKNIIFTQNIFNKKITTISSNQQNKKQGKFFGAFIALPSKMMNEIHFDKNEFSDKKETIVSVKTD